MKSYSSLAPSTGQTGFCGPTETSFFLKGKWYQDTFLDGYHLRKKKKKKKTGGRAHKISKVFQSAVRWQFFCGNALLIKALFNSLLEQWQLFGNSIKSSEMPIYIYLDVTVNVFIYFCLSHSPQLLRAAQHPLLLRSTEKQLFSEIKQDLNISFLSQQLYAFCHFTFGP